MEEILKTIAPVSPIAAALLAAAILLAKYLSNASQPLHTLSDRISDIARVLSDITQNIDAMKDSMTQLNITLTRMIVEREHDKENIERLRQEYQELRTDIKNLISK